MINIYYTSFKIPLEESPFSEYLSLLSPELRERNSRFIRWQDRHCHLLGKLLLLEALKSYGLGADLWNHVEYNSFKRPYLTWNDLDFNISHSGSYVTCAVGENIRLGIDIEVNKDVKFKNFEGVMSPAQWEEIYAANDPVKAFYRYWTIKESVIKADGRGFSIPVDQLAVVNNTVRYEDKLWYVQDLEISNGYNAALATNRPSEFKIHEIDFYQYSSFV